MRSITARRARARSKRREGAHERDEHAQDCGEAPEAAPQAGNLRAQVGLHPLGVLERDHAPTSGQEPTRRRGVRDADARGDRDLARSPDELAESVVVGPARASRGHPGILDSSPRWINSAPRSVELVGWWARGDDDPSRMCRRSWHTAARPTPGEAFRRRRRVTPAEREAFAQTRAEAAARLRETHSTLRGTIPTCAERAATDRAATQHALCAHGYLQLR